MNAREWVAALKLEPHPEGGYFRESYRSPDEIQTAGLPARYGSSRPSSTAIYFLLEAGQVSTLHRLASDEMWHFYAGSPLVVSMIAPDGSRRDEKLGSRPERGEPLQVLAPAGSWFGAALASDEPGAFGLVGCTVAPGFCWEDFEMGDRAALVARFPDHRGLIERLTKLAD